ncbi:T9SS type A sorting domain-containing protein [bacterium]|nr:T9SS type A sorting domain-containing protein [bacterium]
MKAFRFLSLFAALLIIVLPLHAAETVQLQPENSTLSWFYPELDTDFADSVSYFQPNDAPTIYLTSNAWAATRFTPPGNLELQGVRFRCYNLYNNQEDQCRVYIYSDANGQPGENLLDDYAWIGTIPNGHTWVEVMLDEEDYLQLNGGEDFWIIYGPAPGGAYQEGNGWWVSVDQSNTNSRSRLGTGGIDGTYNTILGGDLYVTAGGVMAQFYDLELLSISNTVDRFFLNPDEEIELQARVTNSGNMESPEAAVQFTVVNEDGDTTFVAFADVPMLESGEEIQVTSREIWMAETTGEFHVYGHIILNTDPIEENNEAALLQSVQPPGRWYTYDDGTFEAANDYAAGNGWAQTYIPRHYPVRIDRAMWYFDSANDQTDIKVWKMDGQDIDEVIWSYTGDVHQGWNIFEILDPEEPQFYTYDEGVFATVYMWTEGSSFSKDLDPPISAQNDDMHTMSYTVANNGEAILPSTSGNWSMRLMMSAESNPPHNFSLLLPTNGRRLPPLPLTLSWEAAFDPDPWDTLTYSLYLDDNPDNLVDPLEWDLTETSIEFDGVAGRTYYWTVSASDGEFEEVWADEVYTFTLLEWPEPPGEFNLLTPADGSTFPWQENLTLDFAWEDAVDPNPGDVVRYRLNMHFTGTDFDSTLRFTNIADTTYQFMLTEALSLSSSCEWYVTAFSQPHEVESNQHFSFTIEHEESLNEFPGSGLPSEFALLPVYPNPFNSTLQITVALPESGNLAVKVFDILGNELETIHRGFVASGYHIFTWSPDVASGIYVVQVDNQRGSVIHQKAIFMK